MSEGIPAALKKPGAGLVELERELEALLVEYEPLSQAWPKEPGAVARAEIGRKMEDALTRIGELQYAIATTPARNPARPLARKPVESNCMPRSAARLLASAEGFKMATRIPRRPVIDSVVEMPCFVNAAVAASNSSKPTPAVAANGATLPSDPESSSIVVLPAFMATNIASETAVTPFTSEPKALRTVVNPSAAVVISVTPPIDNLFAAVKILMAFVEVVAPAEMIW